MNIEYYRNFIAIVEAGSISAAAKRVAVAQPALSNQLKIMQKKIRYAAVKPETRRSYRRTYRSRLHFVQ